MLLALLANAMYAEMTTSSSPCRKSELRMAPSNAALVGGVVAFFLSATFMRLKSPFDPVVWEHPTELPALEGTLSPNTRLLAVEHLHEDDVIAPEAFAEGDDGALYTGLWDGRVVELDKNGENPRDVFFTGGVVSAAGKDLGSTTGVDYGARLLHTCHEKAKNKKLTPENERECGRPLGVRWRAGKLYILDAYHGLFELDVKAGRAKHLINSCTDKPQPLGEEPDNAAGPMVSAEQTTLPLIFLNDFVFAQDGAIFLTDSSWKHPRALNRREIIDGGARGRLLRFEPESGDLRTVMCGLHFPNGVEINPSGTKLLLVESLRFRVLEVHLEALSPESTTKENGQVKDSKAVTSPSFKDALEFCGEDETLPAGVRVFAGALPGFVDNLVFDEKFGGYMAAVGLKVALPFSPLHLALRMPGVIRDIIGKLVPIPIIEKIVPKYGMVVVLNLDGSVKESLHDPTGRTPIISSAHRHSKSGYVFLGSSMNPYLGRLRL